ncbi:MAG TPA: cyclic nucleotide-binding domain-containing protein [Nocardioidaceae bacterium]|nr:cyclic nucleotide-binding domain-containing protein [Nocardioidaceae bacterium]
MRLVRNRKVKLLEQLPLFHGCSDADLEYVAKLARDVRFDDGTTLLCQGTAGDEFFLLVEGGANVVADGRTIAHIRAGDYCGEIALLERINRTATVVAVGPVRTLVLHEPDFHAMLEAIPGLRARVSSAAFERLAHHAPQPSTDAPDHV